MKRDTDPEFAVVLGRNFEKLRLDRGLSLHDVAVMSDGEFKPSILRYYEVGARAMSARRVRDLLRVYGAALPEVWPETGQIPEVAVLRLGVLDGLDEIEGAAWKLREIVRSADDGQ